MGRHFRRGNAIYVLLACIFITVHLGAQGPTATILGTVTDPSGAAIAEAAIAVKNVGTGATLSTATDGQGRFRVPELGLGGYEVQASKAGFSSVVRKGITLTVGSESVVDFSLPVGQAQQTVTVEGQATQVETASTAISNLVEPTQMRELPLNGRNFAQLLTLAPGVQQTPSNGARLGTQPNFSVSGSRQDGLLYLLDNENIVSFMNHGTGSGASGNSLGVEAIAEFQTLTNTYSAQFGGNGGVVNAVTKSGTNSVHGSVYEFIRNSALDARNFFDNFVKTGADHAEVPSFRRNQFGGSVGGPIKKDKAFFFFNYEALRQSLGTSQIALVPDVNGHKGIVNGVNVGINPAIASTLALYPTAPVTSSSGIGTVTEVANNVVNEYYLLGRVDYTFSQRDSLYGRYAFDHADTIQPFTASTIPLWPDGVFTRAQFASVEEKHIFSPTLINLARVAFSRPNDNGKGLGPDFPALQYYGRGVVSGGITLQMGAILANLGPNTQVPFSYIPNHFIEGDDVLWTKGAHSLRFGVTLDRIRDNTNNPFQLGGRYSFSSLTAFLQGTALQFAGPLPGSNDGIRDYRELFISPYVQDEWKLSSRLTVNLGLRYEWGVNPTEARHGLTAIVNSPLGSGYVPVTNTFAANPTNHNWAPRIGLAYDPFGDHKTSIRAGFGMFYNIMYAREYLFGYNLSPPYSLGSKANPVYGIGFAGGSTPSLPSANTGFDYQTTTTPYMMQYNFNIQRQLGGATILTVGYVGSAGVHLLANRDENLPVPTIDSSGGYHFARLVNGAIVPNARLNTSFGPIVVKRAETHSNYNALQVSLNRRFSGGWQTQASYTYSKSEDNLSQSLGPESPSSPSSLMSFYQPSRDKGRSDFDRTHTFRLSGLYTLPWRGNQLVEGWQFSGILSSVSGFPFTAVTGFDRTGFQSNFAGRPNLVAGRPQNPILGIPSQWYDATAFSVNDVGTLGNLGRNTLVGPTLVNTDFAVMKNTRVPKISETFALQFRAEVFNIFNHTNLGLPNVNVFQAGTFTSPNVPVAGDGARYNPNAGRITTTTTFSRQIQFGLKILF